MPGTLFVVATPIGNLEDVTMRALRILREVAVIAAEDTRRTSHLLARYAISTPTISLHEHNERSRIRSILERLERGESVALVSDAGTPTISDPGQGLVDAAVRAGVRVESVPGPNAAITALAASGFAADSFTFLGFPPVKSSDRTKWLGKLQAVDGLAVFYEAPHRIKRTLSEILATIGDQRVLVARELTKAHEELVNSTISTVLETLKDPRGEFTVVVNLGHKTNISGAPGSVDAATLLAELGQLTNDARLGRRPAIAELGRRHNLAPNAIYRLLELHKK